MAHTVIWMATVYFTAIVGCAFSSPRRTAENSQDDAINIAILDSESEISEKENVTVGDFVNTTTKTRSEAYDNLEHDRGGTEAPLATTQLSNDTETFELSTEVNGTEVNDTESDPENIVSSKKEIDKESNKTEKMAKKNHSPKSKGKHGCPNCRTWKEMKQDIENRHIETIKSQLLDKLRLSAPPVATAPMPALPMKQLERAYLSDQAGKMPRRVTQHFFAKTVQVFVMGTDVTDDCGRRRHAGCYFFDFGDKVSPSDLYTAELWIYKLFNHNDPYIQTFMVSELEQGNRNNFRRPRNLVSRVETKLKYGWMKIDVKRSVLRWLRNPEKNDGISIVCKGCQRRNHTTIFSSKNDSKPFIVITTRKRYRKRKPRNIPVECTPSTTRCCLAPLEIDFHAIGWTAVIAPRKLKTNYCTGSCHARYAAHGNHTQTIQAYRWSQANEQQMRELTPCCTPISYASQSLIYRDARGQVRAVQVPNIQATSCGCV